MSRFRRLLLILLVLSQVTGVIAVPLPAVLQPAAPTAVQAALPPDLTNHWASGTVSYWMDQALLVGFEDGTARPDAVLERAQMITFINRAMGFTATGSQQFSDVPGNEWYAHEFLLARQAGYFTGFDGNRAYPEQDVTRAEASTLLSRIFNLTPRTPFDDLSRFADYETALVVSPARSSLEAMVERGFLDGYPDNTLRPNAPLTRAVLMSMFSKIMAVYLNEAGVNYNGHGATVTGDVVVRRSPATINDLVIDGDLVVPPGAEDGSIDLRNVQVNGRVLIMGGGDVRFNSCQANEVIINKPGGRRPVLECNDSDFERMLIYTPSDTDIDTASTLNTLVIYQSALDTTINVGPNPKTIELFSPSAQVTLSSSRSSTESEEPSSTGKDTSTETPSVVTPGGVEIFDPNKPQVWMPVRNFRTTVGSQLYIEAAAYPLSMSDRTLNWSSSKSDIVSVNAFGFITANKVGVVTITATSKQRPELSSTATVIVEYRDSTGIALNNTSLTIALKKSAKLQATLFPASVAKQAVSWFSMDDKIATVDQSGTVKGVAVGKTSVIAYASDNPSVQAKCSVSVTSSGTLVEKFTMARDVDTMTVSEKKIFEVQAVTPAKATLQEMNWWSSDTTIAMVYNIYNTKTKHTDAEVHALAPGSFTLYGEAVDGGDATTQVKIAVVPRLADSFVWAGGNKGGLNVGERATWKTVFNPSNAANQGTTWASTKPEYVSVDQNGQLWAHKLTMGTKVEIVAYATYYPNFTPLRAEVNVQGLEVEYLSFFEASAPSQKSVRVNQGGTRSISISVAPGNAQEKKLSFRPKDPSMLSATSTGDTTATLTGLKPGVTQLEVIHDTSGKSLTLWVVVASNELVNFLTALKDRTIINFSNMYAPEKYFYYNSDHEYEAASFFYSFIELNGSRPQPDASHEVVFYGSLNAWMSNLAENERLGRLPREAQTMAKMFAAPNDLSMKLTTTTEEQWQVYRTLGSLWLLSEASFDLGNSDYYTKLRKYLFFDDTINTMAPYTSSQNVNILNLNHLIARLPRDPHGFFDGNISNIARASAFIQAYMEGNGAAATAQICALTSMSQKTSAAERMVFGSVKFENGATVAKTTELNLLAKGYLYDDLDKLLTVAKFTNLVQDVIDLPVYFPNLYNYIKNPSFDMNLAMAYRNYSQLFPGTTPDDVVAYINQRALTGGDYVTLLANLDGRSAIYRNNQRISELQLPLNEVDLTSWRPDRVALYRLDGSAIYYSSSQLEFAWLNGRPVDFGSHILQITVTHNAIGVIARLELPVYVHGSDLLSRLDLIESKLSLSKPLTYQDLLDERVPRDLQQIDEPLGAGLDQSKSLFLLKAVGSAAEAAQNNEIQEGWLEYFRWYYGQGTLNTVVDSLQNPDDIDEFWYVLRATTGDPRSRDEIVRDYTLFKFFDLYLQRWLDIEVSYRKLSHDFLWFPGDFLSLGYLDPRAYIVGLTKMQVDASDKYQEFNNPDGFRSDCPLESHRTGLFFSKSYAFRQVSNISNVGEMIERFIALCNDNPSASASTNTMVLATNWVRDHLRNATQYEIYTYADYPDPGGGGGNAADPTTPDTKNTIDANLWIYLRKINDELLPLLTLPNNSRVRLIVLPGIILVGSAEDYDNQGQFQNGIGQTILNIVYNLEYQHFGSNTAFRHGLDLRHNFKSSWLEEGPVLLFDLDRTSSGAGKTDLRRLFYDPLRYQKPLDDDSFSATSNNRMELGSTIFLQAFMPGNDEQITNWNDELQHLVLEILSLRDSFGYDNAKRLMPQEMGSMMLKQGTQEHTQIDWQLTSSDYVNVPDAAYMQNALQGLWQSRTIFDLWWSDLFLKSPNLMNYSSYRYVPKPSLIEYAVFMHYASSASEMHIDSPDKTYVMSAAADDAERGKYLINGRYRLLGMTSRNNYMADTRYPNFNLLNPPGVYFSLNLDQNLTYDGKTPARYHNVIKDDPSSLDQIPSQVRNRYDLPRVNLMQQIFYRHGWDALMAYLSADTEAAALANLNEELYRVDHSVTMEAYKSWTDWTLQEWDHIRSLTGVNPSVAGLTYWEWQKLIQNSADPGYLKEFFVDHMGASTQNFKDAIANPSDPNAVVSRAETLNAVDTAYRMVDGVQKTPLTKIFPVQPPAEYAKYPGIANRFDHTLPDYFPALWLLNVTAKVGDHTYRTAADNIKLIAYGDSYTSVPGLNPLDSINLPNGDLTDDWVEEQIDLLKATDTVYLLDLGKESINRAWAYGYEDILWMAFDAAGFTIAGVTYPSPRETDATILNLLVHPAVPVNERVTLLTYDKPERDAYLFRRTNPAYNPEYEIAYQNYSLLFTDYDTREKQDIVVAKVNGMGTRYGQDLAKVLSVEALSSQWRDSANQRRLLNTFLTNDSSLGVQSDPRIITRIYEEFIDGAPPGEFNINSSNKSGIVFYYKYDTDKNLSVPLRLDFHDLYERLEISVLPTVYLEDVATKNAALDSYLNRNGSLSYLMSSSTSDVYRFVTLTPMSTNITGQTYRGVDLDPDIKRLGVTSDVYYRSSNFINFSNTARFNSFNSQTQLSQDIFTFGNAQHYTSLVRTAPQIGTHTSMFTSWQITITEVKSSTLSLLAASKGMVCFLSPNSYRGYSYTAIDYVTSLLGADFIYLPELYLSDGFRIMLDERDSSILNGPPALTLDEAERLTLLGYNFEEIFSLSSDRAAIIEILQKCNFWPQNTPALLPLSLLEPILSPSDEADTPAPDTETDAGGTENEVPPTTEPDEEESHSSSSTQEPTE